MNFPLARYLGWRKAPSLAFAATVAVGYLSALWEGTIDFTSRRGIWCVVFGVTYAFFGTVNFNLLCQRGNERKRDAYLTVQGGLLLGIFLTSRLSSGMSFCVYPLVAATVTLLGPLAATLGVVVLYGMVIGVEYYCYGIGPIARWSISMLPGFGLVVIFTLVAMKERVARTRAESLSAEVGKLAVIQERNRLAREIHDSLGHFLTTIHVQLEAARAIHGADPARAMEAVAKAQGLARDALVEVRRSVGALQADSSPMPLATRLRDLASATDGWGAAVALEIVGEPRTVAPDAEHALFRAAQEGLTNVRKHAQAERARVILDYRNSRRVSIRVTDNGRGATTGPDGHGLAGLRERIDGLGGNVVAGNPPGGGFSLQVEIPA